MREPQDFNTKNKPTWCPGCGDYGIWAALKNAFIQMGWGTDDAFIVYGIGCHGHMVNYLNTYGLSVAILRASNTYGGGDLNFSRIIPGAIKSVLNNRKFHRTY